jgi:hypothetical protein
MLEYQIVRSRLRMDQATIRTTIGCPERASSFLWSLVIDKLLTDLHSQGYEVFGFADDIAIMVRGKVDWVLSALIQTGLNYASNLVVLNSRIKRAKN